MFSFLKEWWKERSRPMTQRAIDLSVSMAEAILKYRGVTDYTIDSINLGDEYHITIRSEEYGIILDHITPLQYRMDGVYVPYFMGTLKEDDSFRYNHGYVSDTTTSRFERDLYKIMHGKELGINRSDYRSYLEDIHYG